MFRTVVSLICAIAIAAPTAALAGDRYSRGYYNYNRGDYNRRIIQRVRTIDFYNRNRSFDRRDSRSWDRRDVSRERDWRDHRNYHDRYDYRNDRNYRRDRYSRPSIIIIPRISF